MMPRAVNEDPACYGELGYCLFRHVFSDVEVTTIRAFLDEALTTPLPLPGRHGQRAAENRLDRVDYVGEPHCRDGRWLEVCRHPRLLDAVESILGPNLILVFSSVFIKNPDVPSTVGWHQDNTYWPSVHGTEVATVWLAVDDADEANSAMQVLPGTHRGHEAFDQVPAAEHQMLRNRVPVSPELEAEAVTLSMTAGSLSIHDSFLLHGSGQNETTRRRAGYTIRYSSTDEAWVDVNDHLNPVYLIRGKAGERGSGYMDLRPGVKITEELFETPAAA